VAVRWTEHSSRIPITPPPEGSSRAFAAGGARHNPNKRARYLWRRVHEGEREEVVDAKRLEEQHNMPQVCALNLRDRHGKHLHAQRDLGEQPVAHTGASTARTPSTLPGVRTRHGENLKRIHT
jgi:hypothetical protein